ncbi:hypothetical protein IWQ62_001346 [Dispira parvispora]|uniref:Cation-transporting ATPase n=1 Tax=Dispira parvispora TaxID=1520584 RepID=A0A9W8AWB2_9FUNG|nr:hypothetical protein IWQ62_001346 [Dispira parvispora]
MGAPIPHHIAAENPIGGTTEEFPQDIQVSKKQSSDPTLEASALPDSASDQEGVSPFKLQNGTSSGAVVIDNVPLEDQFSTDPSQQTIFLTEEELTIVVRGYANAPLRLVLFYVLCVLSLGILYVLARWFPKHRIAFVAHPVPLNMANWVVVTNEWGDVTREEVMRVPYGASLDTVFPTATSTNGDGSKPLESLTYFEHRHNRFLFNPNNDRFVHIHSWKDKQWAHQPLAVREGLTKDHLQDRTVLFGSNSIDIPARPVVQLLLDEVLHPFYVFQIMSIILWFCDTYYYYAACILVISIVSIITTYRETRTNERKMREMSRFTCTLAVFRDHRWQDLASDQLVPGDVFEISDSRLTQVPCDAMLLEGDCIVNESMLTGESIPVSKSPATLKTFFDLDLSCLNPGPELSRHLLFSGTKLIRVRSGTRGLGGEQWNSFHRGSHRRATALVVRTGFNTVKGSLVRSILFPRPNKFKFYRDAFRFVGVMAVIAILGFLGSIANFVQLGLHAGVIIKRALDLVTIVVPPALPATMSIGMTFALARLRKKNIFCISPPRINMSGKVNLMCFDKTGTLTEDGLDVLGIQSVLGTANRLSELQESIHQLTTANTEVTHSQDQQYRGSFQGSEATAASGEITPVRLPTDSDLLLAMATCHSLKVVNGDIIGDPVDIKMFEFTQWTIEEGGDESALLTPNADETNSIDMPGSARRGSLCHTDPPRQLGFHDGIVPTVVRPPHTQRFNLERFMSNPDTLFEVGIIRSFEFLPALRRMSVVVKPLQSPTMQIYVKGAPEVITEICRPETVPRDFHARLNEYTHHGYRVIACAGKALGPKMNWLRVQKMTREQVEQDLEFLGFIVFENKLKPSTTAVIQTLDKALIRRVMCTGDNVLTAISVARECGIIPMDEPVYIPRCVDQGSFADGSAAKVVWENMDDPEQRLDISSLRAVSCQEGNEEGGSTQTYANSSTSLTTSTVTNVKLISRDDSGDVAGFSLALTGAALRWALAHCSRDTVEQILVLSQVFARMSPDEKQELVERFQSLEYCVGFCGDGANDCGALKAADMGLSLSEAEASVAAPFTSRSTDIDCVLDLIKEGRCALTTSFSCFKYMALYSIIQFISVSLLYRYGASLGDFQFLYIDLFIIIPVAVFMGNAPPYHKLHSVPPTASLISRPVLSSLFGHIGIILAFQVLAFYLVQWQSWYVAPDRSTVDLDRILVQCYENTVLFMLTNFQYIFMAIVFSIGPPYRQSSFRNYPFLATTALLFVFSSVIILVPHGFWEDLFELVPLSGQFRWILWAIALANCLSLWLGEQYLLKPLTNVLLGIFHRVVYTLTKRSTRKQPKRYQVLLQRVTATSTL